MSFAYSIVLAIIVIFLGVCTDNEWKKVFNHDAAFGVFSDAEDVKLKSPFDPTAPLYSFLDNLDMLKNKEDPYHLKLCYPELTQYSFPCNEWIQSKNPLETTSGNNMDTAITITFNTNGANQNFKGLGTNRVGKDTRTIIDASPTSSNWWFAVGLKELLNDKITGPQSHWVSKVELYMKRTSPSPSGPNVISLLQRYFDQNSLSSASSRRKREVFGGLIEYQEYEELSVRKKREEEVAVVETEQEIALRSYGSRLRFVVHTELLQNNPFLICLPNSFRYECGAARRFLDDFTQLHYLDRWTNFNACLNFFE